VGNTSYSITCFDLDIPIASYMIAVAIGDMQYQSLGGRVGLYAEYGTIDTAIA